MNSIAIEKIRKVAPDYQAIASMDNEETNITASIRCKNIFSGNLITKRLENAEPTNTKAPINSP